MSSLIKGPMRLWPSGQKWAEYNEIVPAGTPKSAVLSRDYWINVERSLRPLDVINCLAEDGSFDLSIRLLSKTSTTMKFRVIREAEIEDTVTYQPERAAKYRVVSGGRAGGWRVQEIATGSVLADGLDKGSAEVEREKLEREAA